MAAPKDLFLLVDEEGLAVEDGIGMDDGAMSSGASSSSSSSSCDLLRRSNDHNGTSSSSLGQEKGSDKGICLKKGEVFVTSVDVKCRGTAAEDGSVLSPVNIPTGILSQHHTITPPSCH